MKRVQRACVGPGEGSRCASAPPRNARRLAIGAATAAAAIIATPAPIKAALYTFRQDLNGYMSCVDTTISTSQPSTPAGSLDYAEWQTDVPAGSGQDNFALIRFDDIFGNGPGQIPPGTPIISASLTYSLLSGSSVGTANELVVSWDSNTTFNTLGGAGGVQSSDYGAEAIFTASGTFGGANVLRSVVKWSDNPALNRGWIIRPTNSSTFGRFRSSEHATPGQRPVLSILTNDSGVPTLLRRPYLNRATPTSIVVRWRTDIATDSRVRFGDAPGNLTQEAVNPVVTRDHEVVIPGLSPQTRSYYDVGSTTLALAGADASHYFMTHPERGVHRPCSAFVAGDTGSANGGQAAARNAVIATNGGVNPDFYLNLADMAYINTTDAELTDNFFSPYQTVLRSANYWPCFGNHEGFNNFAPSEVGPYFECFTLPRAGESGGAASGTEGYYSFDYGDAHFISLNSDQFARTPGSPMLNWLAADLAASADQKWLIAFWHHPPYSKGTHDSDVDARMTDMRRYVGPMLESAGVDLVLCGHSHGYERTFLVNGAYDTPTTAPGHIVSVSGGDPSTGGVYTKGAGMHPNEGAVYVVAGHGASAHWVMQHPLMYFTEMVVGACLLTINGDTLEFKNVRQDGVISDRFTIVKQNATPPCPGDLTGDGQINAVDLANLLGAWGPGGGPADITNDGVVGAADLASLLGGWGPCPT